TDMFFQSTFPEEEIEREKKVVIEEIKMYEDSPDSLVHDFLSQAMFGDHTLGRPIIGTEEHVRSFTRQSLIDYMDEFYTADNVVISISGNVDKSFISKVEALFDQFTNESSIIYCTQNNFQFNSILLYLV